MLSAARVRVWKLVVATAGTVAICGTPAYTLEPSAPLASGATQLASLRVAPPPMPHAGAGEAMQETRRGWLPPLFAPATPDERDRALAQLDAMGLHLEGEAFVRAIRSGHRPLVELFLKAGINPSLPGENGVTPLLAAAWQRDWTLFQTLLEAEADINAADANGVTPLMVVTAAGDEKMLETLLAKGAQVEATDARGHRAVHFATVAGKAPALKALLERGASAEGMCCEGHDLLEHALERNDWNLVEPVLVKLPPTQKWRPATTALLTQCIQRRAVEPAKLLLSRHPAAPKPEGSAQPMLGHAIVKGDRRTFEFLLACGADPNTPLNSPVEKEFASLVSGNFLKHYLNTEPGMTVLMLAAGLGRMEYVRPLVEKGAKRGQGTDKLKMPALLFAARTEATDVLQLLVGDAPKPEELRVEISLSQQRATVFRNGSVLVDTEVSTGRPGFATPSGSFIVTDKHASHRSTIYKVPMPFFMRLNCRDFGMHQGVVPGVPASHGCIRVPAGTAQKLFKQIPVGTLVTITP